jgi:hypothetical protein
MLYYYNYYYDIESIIIFLISRYISTFMWPLLTIHTDRLSVVDFNSTVFNPLNAELNPICHLLVLLGDLTFMGSCIVSIFQYTRISNKMQRYAVYLYLETALHVSGGISTYHQEHIQLYLQHLVFVTPLLLSAAIVEELKPVPPETCRALSRYK